MDKKYKLTSAQIRDVATGYGACFAADTITVEGQPVGFMYREEPDNDVDSGWRFLAGTESDEYMDNADNFAIYDVNTIANYDPDIVFFLDACIGSAFERVEGEGFVEVDNSESPLH
ncbi:MAG TPA: DUF2185 domain-containing protein [Polyangiaceae bacterium]|nr:DUF2185 domain-containing protein [Polyangiaceae bacterium]